MTNSSRSGKLYFVSGTFSGAGAVKVIDADGSNETTLAEGKDVIEPDGIEADIEGGKLYWTDMGLGGAADKSVAADDGRIMRADLDGKNLETLVPTGMTTTPKQLALDVAGGKVYWSDRGDVGDQNVNPKIMRSNLDGSSVETIVSSDLMSPVGIALHAPIGVALDRQNGRLFYTDVITASQSGGIWQAELDGRNARQIATTALPLGLCFVP